MLNKVMLIGRLGRDPEVRYTQAGKAIANLRIATDESYVDREGNKVERVEWHSVIVYERSAEACGNHLGKGSLVFVEGSLTTRKWQDQNGQDKYTTEVKAQRVQFLDRKQADGGTERGAGATQTRNTGNGSRRAQNGPQNGSSDERGPAFPTEAGGLDDVPFAVLLIPFAGLLCHMLQTAGMVA